jgi:hypothetical protein
LEIFDNDKAVKRINKVRDWFNQKLLATINNYTEIDLELNKVLKISKEDQYSSQYITIAQIQQGRQVLHGRMVYTT